jgi:ParB/RepB/Spo0J family partition protein
MAKASPFRPVSALFGASVSATDLVDARSIAVDELSPNPFQPRRTFDEQALDELAASIRADGVLQPLLVRPTPGHPATHQIAAGERRWRAARRAALTHVPCVVRDLSDDDMERVALVENIQRDDLTPLDEARAYRRLIERLGLSMRALADRLGKHHSIVQDRLKLLSDPRIEVAVERGTLGASVAVEIVNVESEETRTVLLERVARGEQVRLKDVRTAALPAWSTVAEIPPQTPIAAGSSGEVEAPDTEVAEFPPLKQRLNRTNSDALSQASAVEPHPAPAPAHLDQRDNAAVPTTAPEHWVRAEDLQNYVLLQAGGGRADPDQLRAALWADLDALDG